MISTWFENPHVLRRPYNFAQVREVSTPQRRGLSGLYGMGDLSVEDLPIYTPGVDYTPDMLSSSWAATLSSAYGGGGSPTSASTRYAGPGIPNTQVGGISPMLIGIGLLALILVSGGHSGGRR
jgi:hypothetical protein